MAAVGVVCALEQEAACLRSLRKTTAAHAGAHLRRSGPGAERARAAAQELIAAGASGLLSFGFAGALVESLQPGDLCLPLEVLSVDRSEPAIQTSAAWRERVAGALEAGGRKPAAGALLQSDAVAATAREKRALATAHAALAVDLESYAVGRAAQTAGLPFLVLRAVSDGLERSLPPAALAGVDAQGLTRPAAVLSQLARRPGDLLGLIRLGLDARRARRALTQAAHLLGPRLECPD